MICLWCPKPAEIEIQYTSPTTRRQVIRAFCHRRGQYYWLSLPAWAKGSAFHDVLTPNLGAA